MFKLLYILVISFFFFILFSFSHIFYIFWSDYIFYIFWRWWYEWIKSSIVILYWILFSIWLFIYFLKYKINRKWNNFLIYIGIIIFLILISTLLSIDFSGSIIWLSEKYEWFLYYLSLIIFFVSLYFWFEEKEYKKVLNYIFLFSLFLYLYGFIQYLWFDPLANLYNTRVEITRASSFFWNANYLAGYIVILLPLSKFINNIYFRRIFIWISLLSLLTTWSYFWIFLWVIYILYIVKNFNKKIFIWLFVIFISYSIFIWNSLWVEKKWSFLARPFIWESSILAIIDKPKTILFWYWPDTLQLIFNNFKVPELSVYETSYYTADRTNNIFLDLIYFFWFLWWWFIIFFIINWIKLSKNINIKLTIILFLIFFSFNIPVTIHFVLILFILSAIYNWNNLK